MPYRQRLIIEGFECKRDLYDIGLFHNFLEDLTKILDMRVIVPPSIVRVPVPSPAPEIETGDHGLSGFLIWIESGAQIHSWPRDSLLTLDIYSCKRFEEEAAIGYFLYFFHPGVAKVNKPLQFRYVKDNAGIFQGSQEYERTYD